MATHNVSTPAHPHPHRPLFDNVVQSIYWFVGLQVLSCVFFLLPNGPLQLPDKYLKLSKLLQQRLVGKERNVLDIVVGLWSTTALVQLFLLQGLMWVDALQDAQPPGEGKRATSTESSSEWIIATPLWLLHNIKYPHGCTTNIIQRILCTPVDYQLDY